MTKDAILFDKDGTLIDFDAFWVSVSFHAIEDVATRAGVSHTVVGEVLEAFGVCDGKTHPNAVLCKGTYEQMGEIVYDIFRKHGASMSREQAIEEVLSAYNRHANAGEVRPTCPDLVAVLSEWKRQNKKLAVITTDNVIITRKCLQELGIEHLFDCIYTDDGNTPVKPDPYCALDFCRRFGIPKERAVMIGDTLTDVRFAQNAGIACIGIAQNEQSKAILSPHADLVVSAMSDLRGVLV